MLLLVALFSVLLGNLAPRIRRTFDERRRQEEFGRRSAVYTDLIAAVRADNVPRARQALDAGAEPDRAADYSAGLQRTRLLRDCVVNAQFDMMELLLDYGADIERIDQLPSASGEPLPVAIDNQSAGKGTQYMHGPPVFVAAGCNQPPEVRCELIRRLVARGANPRRHVDGGHVAGFTAMDVAFYISDAQTAELLREYGVPYGPREMAGFNRLEELKQAVHENPEILNQRFRPIFGGQGPTLLAIALERGYREMALFLIDSGAPLDTLVYHASTLLHQAAHGDDDKLIRLLVARGLDVNATDRYSDTPLTVAAWHTKPQAVAALLDVGADVDHQGASGRTALYNAVWNGRPDIVRMLLSVGADPTLPDVVGETPLKLARRRSPNMVELIEQAAALKQKP
ncbi:MAG TPA: ankyrin repeat domain-containing protein [Pirellulales bacterium]|nr:ankyrin repeat domain-containing protein [Pirellulales bacterium]